MSIDSINGVDSTSSLWWLEAIKKKEETTSNPDTSVTATDPTAGNVDVSPMGQMLAKLDSLATSDPDKFKEVTAQIAEKLTTAANGATGSDAELLKRMADRFKTASESGDISALQPQQRPHHGHGHRHARYADNQSGTADSTATPTPPAPDGAPGGPSDSVRSAMDDVFKMVSEL